MAKKKSKGPKKKGQFQLAIEQMAEKYTPPPPEAFKKVEDKYVLVHIRLMNWTYLNFDYKTLESTNLYILRQKILQRHGGSIYDIQMYKDQVNPNCLLTDFTKSLRDVFRFDEFKQYAYKKPENLDEPIEVTRQSEPVTEVKQEQNSEEVKKDTTKKLSIEEAECAYECVIYYNFTPFHTECPLLLSEPRLAALIGEDEQRQRKRSGTRVRIHSTATAPINHSSTPEKSSTPS